MVAGALGACGSDPQPFTIHLSLDTTDLYMCPSAQCSDYGMACGATLGVRIVDADTLDDEEPRELFERCIAVAAAPDLCAIADVPIAFEEVPTRTLQVQVTIWAATPPGQIPTCPDDVFDLRGIPISQDPQPAFGGVAFVEAGTDPVAEVRLACRDPQLINAPACLTTNRVTVRMDDMQTVVPVRIEDARSLNVAVGEPRLDTSIDPPVWVIGPADQYQMELVDPGPIPPVWNRNEVPTFSSTACVLSSADVAQPITAVSCTRDLTLESDGRLDVTGLMLTEEVLGQLLQAANLDGFPPKGLVIGRVVDHLGAPLGGVTVTPVPDDNVNVAYVSSTRDSISLFGPTSTDGFFISFEAPFGTQWQASSLDGRMQASDFRAGLITGKASVVIIEMTAP
ncbi:MAG TPA: hypothetical protein VML75_09535 [Kofleriaceae bacterium]|nr:hypothetical protein [Kofleriaceae bacterium]